MGEGLCLKKIVDTHGIVNMWTCHGLSVYTLSVFIVCTTHVGGTEFPQKCLGEFNNIASTNSFCINGNLEDIKVNSTCNAGEYRYIEDFVLHLPKDNNSKCLPLNGFNYKQTVQASCLNKENKELSTLIASALKTFDKNIIEVQSSLNKNLQGMYVLSVQFQCHAENVNSIDICKDEKIEGLKKGVMKLDTESLRAMTLRPSSCTCSVVSSEKNITISAVDVFLAKTQRFQYYVGNDSSGFDIFEKDTLLWKKDEKKVITSSFINFNLSVGNKFNFSQSLWIELEGLATLNITCSPLFNNESESDGADVSHESNSAGLVEIIVGLAIGGFVTLVVLIILVVCVVSRRRNRTEQGSLTKRAPSTSLSENKEAIYAEPDNPVTETKTPLVSSNYTELEKNIYAEPGPANNNFKLGDLTSQSCTDEESDNLVPNIYNHLGEQPVPSQSHIYDTTGSHDYSTTFDRKNKPKVIHNIYDR
uniref:Uncharacterized protein n=1 Tax=Biomphalaria glabrata TaxID=6526 RepID=A0A2C9KCP5_BIOGL